jgi:translation initiation factor 2 subunit 2
MKNYEDMLKDAIENLPKSGENKERFEVPKPITSIQGNQTIISNFEEICNTLRRDKKHVSKFLFKELAIPGHIEGKRLILQGKATTSLIEKKLENYVRDFVICKECKKPDTSLQKIDRLTFLVCEACGAKQNVKKI